MSFVIERFPSIVCTHSFVCIYLRTSHTCASFKVVAEQIQLEREREAELDVIYQ